MTSGLPEPLGHPQPTGAFLADRCGPYVVQVLDADDRDETSTPPAGPAELSLFEIHTGMDDVTAADHDVLVVLALHPRGTADTPDGPAWLRLVTRDAVRSASRSTMAGWVATNVRVPMPEQLYAVSLLVYSVRRTPRLERALQAIENLFQPLEARPAGTYPALERMALDWLQVLDHDEDAQLLVGGSMLPVTDPLSGLRYVAVVAGEPPGWLRLHEGRLETLAKGARTIMPYQGPPCVLLRYGSPTARSGREFIEEIRRRHRNSGVRAASPGAGQSFVELVERQLRQERTRRAEVMFGHIAMLPVVTPIAIEIAGDLVPITEWTDESPTRFKQLLDGMRESVQAEFGVQVPAVRMRGNEGDLSPGDYIIMIDEIPIVMGKARTDRLLCLASSDELPAGLTVDDAENTTRPGTNAGPACWVPTSWGETLHAAGLETWAAEDHLVAHLHAVVVNDLPRLTTMDALVAALDGDERIRALHGTPGGLPGFAAASRALLADGLPITPIGALADAWLEAADRPLADRAEDLRLAPAVRSALVRDRTTWRRFELDDACESTVREGMLFAGDGAVLALTPERTQTLLTAVRATLQPPSVAGGVNVIVVQDARLRPFVRALTVLEFPAVRVLAQREIAGLTDLPSLAGKISED